ncbi:amidohydrolase family protein [Humitalea sp. 24SJ18S-53]|uniref:amidohydrolase family protein n=1 Tax=Humitalea sp. 24SJ18S-53 TaxID=3422307 RepID=UPI003D67FF4F
MPTRIIDSHCHIFNVDDLPVYRFLRHVALPERCLEHLDALAWLLAKFLKALAPGAEAERRVLLASSARGAIPAEAPVDDPQRREDALANALGMLRNHARGDLRPRSRAASLTEEDPLPPRDQAAALLQLLRQDAAPSGLRSRSVPQRARTLPADPELRAIARDLVGSNAQQPRMPGPRASVSLSNLAMLFRWAGQLAGYRHRLASTLGNISGAPTRPVLLTPALIDFGRWIHTDREFSTGPAAVFAVQVEMMALIAAGRPGGALVHPFVPYDPWHAAVELAAGRANPPLALVRDAIGHRGAVGVKLYPPMGFRAWRNAEVAADEYPVELREETGGRPGYWLDRALGELYEECARLDAPIMAHCADSNEGRPRAGLFADPTWWEAAVQEFRELRVNLGHFGGVWLLDGDDKRCDGREKANWTLLAADIVARHPRQVWADMSYFAEVLSDGKPREDAVKALRHLAANSAAPNLLYGSDWIMMGQEQGASDYASQTMSAAAEAGLPLENFAWRSAARFLGLDREGQSRDRLLAFHARDPAALTAIRGFMPGLSPAA